jgi:hypothetical protein
MMRLAFALLLALLLALPAAAQQKTIKDPAEYKAYMAAYEQKDAARRAVAMEAFAARYPQSVVRLDALEQAMAGFQQSGHRDKVTTLAAEILKLDPDNLRALALHVFMLRGKATADNDGAALAELKPAVERGLSLLARQQKPAGLGEADFARLKAQLGGILEGAAGFVALQAKDYDDARPHYLKAVAAEPGDLQNVYQLALACLEPEPPQADGFWYLARAVALADKGASAAVQDSIKKYAAAKYARYHGSDAGWNDILAKAAKSAAKPAGFTVKPAP